MELKNLFTMNDVRSTDRFFGDVDELGEVIIIKNDRPAYKVIRLDYPYDGEGRVNLWKAMSDYLVTCENDTAHARDITENINETRTYITRNAAPVTPVQVRARAQAKPEYFECQKGNIIRLLKPYDEE